MPQAKVNSGAKLPPTGSKAKKDEAADAKISTTETSLDLQLIGAAGKADTEAVTALLARGANAKFYDDPEGVWGSRDAKSALHMALASSAIYNSPSKAKDVILALVEAGADVNATRQRMDWRGCGSSDSAFDMLLSSKLSSDPAVLEAFLAAGADPNARQVSQRHSMRTDGARISYPLHTAVIRSNANVVGVLLRAGSHVDARHTEKYHNERGYNQDLSVTALHKAIDSGKMDAVLVLLAEGADPNALATWLQQKESNEVGTTDDPRAEGFVSEVVCVPVRETCLHKALVAGNVDVARALLAAGADPAVARTVGDAQEATIDLAARIDEEKGLNGSLRLAVEKTSAGWSEENHKYFSEQLKDQVRTVLLVAKAANWNLPDDALHQIFVALAARPNDAPAASG